MMTEINIPIECSVTGCTVVRRSINHWYVVVETKRGVEIIRWDDCPLDLMKTGSRVCGLDHAFKCASKMLTPDNTVANRESTMVLAPPLTREGVQIPAPSPIAVLEEKETGNENL